MIMADIETFSSNGANIRLIVVQDQCTNTTQFSSNQIKISMIWSKNKKHPNTQNAILKYIHVSLE